MHSERIALADGGYLVLFEDWLAREQTDALFAELRRSVPWEQRTLQMFGRTVMQPRLTAWYGDPGAEYAYSGLHYTPLAWSEPLRRVRERVERTCAHRFNSVLLNFYRDGNDSVGFHADREPELGTNPVIASVSLGEARPFVLKHRRRKNSKVQLVLPSGSLLLMAGTTQHHYVHALPKRRGAGPRINLTFRWVH